MALIQLKNVTVKFENQEVLSAVNLEVQAGESVVFVGPSGLGKTTLLKTMAGLVEPSTGELFIAGNNFVTQSRKSRELQLKKMGMLFQKNALFDSLTCGENIAFPLRETTNLSEQEITEKVAYFLDAVGISHARDLYPDEISGGMQKRLGIARALALDPEIIFYDDPTAGLDPVTSKKIIELILELKKARRSTVLAVTNDMNRAYQMADRIILVLEKSLLETGSPEQTRKHSDPRVRQFVRGEVHGPLTSSAEVLS